MKGFLKLILNTLMGYEGPSNSYKNFFVPLLTTFLSCLSKAGVFIFHFLNHAFSHTALTFTHKTGYMQTYMTEFPQWVNSVLMHQDFSFNHCEDKQRQSCWLAV